MTAGSQGFAGLMAAAESIRAGAAERDAWIGSTELAGIGWATVELERAAREVGEGLGIDPAAWVPAPRDAVLGARAWSGSAGGDVGLVIVLLEPDTEGRLAATLVRFGEGMAAIYLRGPAPGSAPDHSAKGIGASATVQSALGPARLVPGGPAWGPHLIALEVPAGEPPSVDARGTGRGATIREP